MTNLFSFLIKKIKKIRSLVRKIIVNVNFKEKKMRGEKGRKEEKEKERKKMRKKNGKKKKKREKIDGN